MRIATVTVIGASGTMGANIAGIFASFGDAKVYCVGRNVNSAEEALPRIIKSVKADSIKKNLIPVGFDHLEECVSRSDLIIESCKEDLSIKLEIAKRVGKSMKPNAISGTGSSGLSISTIVDCYPEEIRSHFFGIHLFNPPYTLPLCELISTKYSDPVIKHEIEDYLRSILHRTVVEVKDSPAFLGNRIGFQFINEALLAAEKYKDNGGIDYIDAIIGPFTGRVMPPLVTSDFVGLDVHKAIVDNIYSTTDDYAHDSFLFPEYANELVDKGKLGRKTGGGLYQLVKCDNGFSKMIVYDVSTGLYRDAFHYAFPFAEKMKISIAEGDYVLAFDQLINNCSQESNICLVFLLKYILYSLYCADMVGYNVESADDVMAAGFNWCPPIAMYQALSIVVDVKELIKKLLPEICKKIDINYYLSNIKNSKYDYRKYFKSGRKNK